MAGEDYTSPINGKTYRVPKYEEPADAPVAFKDFADNLPPGGIDFDPDRVGQVVQSLDGAAWDKGMALQVVDAVPDDSDGDVGDVVFIPGGPGGLPAVGGGKVLQVVREAATNNFDTTSTSYVPIGLQASITPTNASSVIMAFCSLQVNTTATNNEGQFRVAKNNNGVAGAEQVMLKKEAGTALLTAVGWDSHGVTSTVTYEVQARVSTGGPIYIRGDLNTSHIILMEVAQ